MVVSSIKAIIFDLGNVLIDFDHRVAARRIGRFTDKKAEEIYSLFFNSALTNDFEAGRINPQEFFSRVKEILGATITYEQFVPIWNEIFFLTQKNLAVYRRALALKGGYRMAVVSNINTLHYAYVKQHFPVFDAFDCVIASCEVKSTKPDPAIYRATLQALGVRAEETFYTDDRSELIEGASRLGIRAYCFTGVEQLEADLAHEGIRVNAYAK